MSEAEILVRIRFDVNEVITLTREFEILKNAPPVEIDFWYTSLQNFCTTCGSLKHEFEVCDESTKLSQQKLGLVDTGTNPYAMETERNDAISKYLIIKEQ